MKKFIYLIFVFCIGVLSVNAVPTPTEESNTQPFYMDEHNVLQENPDFNSKSPSPDSGQYNENTPKFQYEPTKENDDGYYDEEDNSELEDNSNPINYDASSENIKDKTYTPPQKPLDESEMQSQSQKIKTKPKKTKKPKVKRNEEVFLLDPNATDKLPENNMSSPQQKHYSQSDYEQAYRDMQIPTFSFVHGIDPDQYYDMKDSAWSPYPLFRLNSPLYFKTMVIPPGYYLLTPRQYKSKWYILFKEAGVVKYIIPVFNQSYAEAGYYHTHLKELDMKKTQRWQIKFLNAWGKYIKRSKRQPATQTNLELTDLDNNFLLIELYYGHYKYSTLFRTEKF